MHDEGRTRRDPTAAQLDRLLLGGHRRYTRAQVAQLSGLAPDRFRRLWHALGFAEAAEDGVVFTDDDVAALRTLSDLADAGSVGPGTEASFARALAQPLARLADWQAPLLTGALARDRAGQPDQPGTPSPDEPPAADALLSRLREVQDHVWRRHLAAAVERAPTAPPGDEIRELAVGFADLVGYTTRTRGMSGAELGVMVEDFEATAAEVVARGGGRVVKTVGDGVLFTASDPAAAAGRSGARPGAHPARGRVLVGGEPGQPADHGGPRRQRARRPRAGRPAAAAPRLPDRAAAAPLGARLRGSAAVAGQSQQHGRGVFGPGCAARRERGRRLGFTRAPARVRSPHGTASRTSSRVKPSTWSTASR